MQARFHRTMSVLAILVGSATSSLASAGLQDEFQEGLQEGSEETRHKSQQQNHHTGEAAEPQHHHPKIPGHTLGVFLGDTTEDRRDGFTVGLEYEYRFSEHYGVGLTLEHVAGDFHTDVFVAPVAWHDGPWKLYAGPGVEDGEEGTETLFRAGVEYGFHVGKLEISPQVDMDFVGGDRLLVFGVVFAIGF